MSISGPLGPRSLSAYGIAPAARTPTARPAAPASPAAAPGAAASVDATMPKGSDPNLWSVLTTEEKSFFLRQSQLGPVTYGPNASKAGGSQAPRGGRLDVSA